MEHTRSVMGGERPRPSDPDPIDHEGIGDHTHLERARGGDTGAQAGIWIWLGVVLLVAGIVLLAHTL